MIDTELFQEINNTFKNHKEINELQIALENDINLSLWAHKFSTSEFGKQLDLSHKLFDYAIRVAKEFRDYKDYAFYISKDSGLANKEMAKEAYKLAIPKITILRDLRNLADTLSTKSDSFYDKEMARVVYTEVLEKSSNAYDYLITAESVCNETLLNDKIWAKEIYSMALESATNDDESTYIADSIADEENLGDEKWAEKIYSKTE